MLGSDRPPAALGSHLGFLTVWLGQRSRVRFTARLEPLGLHPRAFGVMTVLAAAPGETQQAVGASVDVDPSTMVALLDGLEDRGLVERRPHPSDRRKRTVHLTATGEAAVAEAMSASREVTEDVFGRLDGAEREELKRLLQKAAGMT